MNKKRVNPNIYLKFATKYLPVQEKWSQIV